jgi:hypothetical protein
MKIGLTFLGFFYHFLELLESCEKKKRKKNEQSWPNFSLGGPTVQGTGACPRARAADFAERPSVFWLTGNGFFHYFIESLTVCKKAPHVLIIYEPRSPTAMSAAELR